MLKIFTSLLLIFYACATSIADRALTLIEKKINHLRKFQEKSEINLSDKFENSESHNSLLKLLSEPKSQMILFKGIHVILANNSIIFANETDLLAEQNFSFSQDAKTFINNFSYGASAFLIVEEQQKTASMISISGFNKTSIKTYSFLNETGEQFVVVNNVIISRVGQDLFFTTIDQGKFIRIHTFKNKGEHIVKILKTDFLYYIFTNNALYFIDSYNLQVNKLENFQTEITDANFLKSASQGFFAVLDKKNRLTISQIANKFELVKIKQVKFKGDNFQFFGQYLVVTKNRDFLIFNSEKIIKSAPNKLGLIRIKTDQFVWAIEENPHGLKIYTRSQTEGLISYEAKSQRKTKGKPGWGFSFESLRENSKYLVPLSIPILIVIFAFIKIQKNNKQRNDAEMKKKKDVERFLRSHQRRIDELSEQVKNISGRVDTLVSAEVEDLKKEIHSLR